MKNIIVIGLLVVATAICGGMGARSFGAEVPRDCSFLLSQMGKDNEDSLAIEPLSDLGGTEASLHHPSQKAWTDSDMTWRLKVLRDFEIGDLIAAPGHRFLRKPQQIDGLIKYIKENNGGDFTHDKLVFNIITDKDHNITSVDIWNAHHRAVAYVAAGYKTMGELDPKNLEILVNGFDSHRNMWPHFLPAAGVDTEEFHDYGIVPRYSDDIRPGTISVNGAVSNYRLGSRGSVRQLYYNMREHHQPKIGIYFGAFDPIHEGHVATAKKAIAEFGLDEVVFVPNVHPTNKTGVTDYQLRVEMLAARLHKEPKLNYYKADSSVLIDHFGRDPFVERIGQIYGTKLLFQIAGSDSIEKLLKEGNINPQGNRTYIALGRKDQPVDELPVPEHLKSVVLVSKNTDDEGLSSTEMRKLFSEGKVPPAEKMDPAVTAVVLQNKLYR